MTSLTSEIKSDIRTQIQHHLTTQEEDLLPCFYALTGSHLYGTSGTASDIDIKGFHCANGSRYMLFDSPETHRSFQASISSANTTIEITSYELRKFGTMLLQSDFSIIELIGSDMDVYIRDNTQLHSIEEILEDTLPGELPVRYLGMAESIYERDVKDTTPTDPSDLKPYVYSLRGCLAAEYVQKYAAVEPRLQSLAATLLEEESTRKVKKFINALQAGQLPSQAVLTEVRLVINEKLGTIEASQFETEQRSEYKTALADWMLAVREETGTR